MSTIAQSEAVPQTVPDGGVGDTPQTILEVALAYCEHTGKAESTVSRLASGSGNTFKRLRDGHTITYRRADRIIRWFTDNWPENVCHPEQLRRHSALQGPESARSQFSEKMPFSLYSSLSRGWKLTQWREKMPPAEYVARLRRLDITEGTAQRDMAVYRLVTDAPRALRKRLVEISDLELRELAVFSANELEASVARGEIDLDAVPKMPRREFLGVVRRLKRRSTRTGDQPARQINRQTEKRETRAGGSTDDTQNGEDNTPRADNHARVLEVIRHIREMVNEADRLCGACTLATVADERDASSADDLRELTQNMADIAAVADAAAAYGETLRHIMKSRGSEREEP